jgi:DeoR family transcriptional regulator of aga operon
MAASPNLSGTERQQTLLELLAREQRLTVARICEQFEISEATARRDLDALAEMGQLQRVHGGAIALRQAPPELPIHQRSLEQSDEKRRIGAAAADMVADGQTIFLGSGTSVLEMARNLGDRRDLTVITNSLLVINALAGYKEITLIALGGMFRQSELSFIGHITEQALAELRADKVFIGTRAIDVEEGLTNAYLPETMTDRAILHIAREVVVLADHSKCGRTSTVYLAPLSAVHCLVTDQKTPHEFVQALTSRGLRVVVV